eukprot:TRINITY_DN15306_c0_g1_i1.p1 TRINITY_DN15306_c0_g1~~TRINITY_DN15306_c0_g1_i1.p1  ORF type:complete len:365 (+),score=54.35 TRINITY_DN15306_c0_g1_i1:58-1095(+)
MKGAGFYANNSAAQRSATELALPTITKFLPNITLPHNLSHITIADYGCADGANSTHLFDTFIDFFQERFCSSTAHQERQFTLIHNDVPTNDFNSLVTIRGPLSRQNVFEYISARSFYNQVAADSSVHVGFTGSAIHWLSSSPSKISDHIYGQLSQNEKINQVYKEQAEKDWKLFIQQRSREMVPGGMLFVVNLAPNSKNLLVDYLSDIAKEILSTEQFLNINFPLYFRNKNELIAPLQETHFDFLGFDEFVVSERSYNSNIDPETWAAASTKFVRAWSETSMTRAFDNPNNNESKQTIDLIYAKLQSKLLMNKESFVGLTMPYNVMVIRKKNPTFSPEIKSALLV